MTATEHGRGEGSGQSQEASARQGRRAFLATVGLATAAVTALTVGQTVPGLRAIDVFGARDGSGPQQLPVNKTAASAEVEPAATDPAWRLHVVSPAASLSWSRAELLAMPQADVDLPIACVEGWSADAHWSGVRLRDLLAAVSASKGAKVRVNSIQPHGAYRIVDMGPEFAHHRATLVALKLNGKTLNLDHGFPARMIAPNRPGVLQTKWLDRIEVLA